MQTLMVDMDDVLTEGMIRLYIEEFYHKKVDLNKIDSYLYVQECTSERTKEFWDFMKEKDFYEGATLYDDVFDVLKELNKKYDLYIVTSYLWQETYDLSGKVLKYKYYYLKDKLPFIDPSKYIFTTNKNIINFDIRIDDKISNLEGAKTKLLFTAWHNRKVSDDELKKQGITRVNSWLDIKEELLD